MLSIVFLYDFTNRNRISVTVLLAVVTLFSATANTDDYPKTTYLKYIDVWFLFYLTSIFLIISHHITLEMMWRNDMMTNPIKSDVKNHMNKDDAIERRIFQKKKCLNNIGKVGFPLMIISFNIVYFRKSFL